MKSSFYLLSSLLLLSTSVAINAYAKNTNTEQHVIQLKVSELKPTQPSIGFKEVDYKVATYQLKSKKLFNDYCKDNGGKAIQHYSKHSTLTNPNSFQCKKPLGSLSKDLKTAVMGPDHQYYLTDGHHLVSELNKISGENTPIFVRITDDQSQRQSMPIFWNNLQQHSLTWLKDTQGQAIQYQSLPDQISESTLQDDEYRSIMYFLKGIAYTKPKNLNIPFFEFYLAEWMAKKVPLSTLKLDTRQHYYQSLRKVAYTMTAASPNETIVTLNGQNITAQQFGIFNAVDKDELNNLIDPQGKVTVLFTSYTTP